MESPPSVPVSGRFTAVAAGLAVLAALAGSAIATASDQAGTAVFAQTLSFAFAVGAVAVTGAVIAVAVPGNRVGWLLLAAAAVMGIGVAFTEAGVHGVVTHPGSVPGASYLAAFGPGLQAAGMLIAVVAVPVFFPDGRLPGPRWRWLAWCTAAAVASLFLGNVLSPHAQQSRLARWQNPFGLPGADALSTAGVLLAAIAAGGAITGLVIRWRRGGPVVRQQLLFLALAAIPPVLTFLVILFTNGVPGWLFGVVLLPLPVAIAIAVLGRGLYDLRRAAQRTLLWLVMSGVVIGIYAVVVIAAAALDELGLAGACAQAVERLTSGADLVVSVDARDLPALPAALEVAAYRIVVEAVTNTVRHARARHCQVSMACTPAGLAVAVADDGTGLRDAAGDGHRHGHGLAIMRERAEELGGTVTVSDASPGVAVEARLPAVPAVGVPDVEVAGTAGTAEEALALLAASPPDVVLMDINLPGASGVEATRRAAQIAPGTAVLVISMVDDDDSVFAALAAGARGYVLKGASAAEITAALRTVAAGGAVFGAGIASRLLAQAPGRLSGRARLSEQHDLTAREREVLDQLAEGASNRQIARALGISLKTVQNHVSRILDKLQAADRTAAVLRARGVPGGG